MADVKTFDPSRYLSKVGKADYLEVKWRMVWLREVHPDAEIDTELVTHDPDRTFAMFKAVVSVPGGGRGTGYGSETARDFGDYIEKAETKAIGRALATLGFGTQFSAFEFGGESDDHRPVDSPVLPPRGRSTTQNAIPANGTAKPTIQNPGAPVSVGQANYIRGLAKQLGMAAMGPDGEMHVDEQALGSAVGLDYDADWPNVTMGQASEIIEGFKEQLKRKAAGR